MELGKLRQYYEWILQNGDYFMNMVMKTIDDPSENFWSKQFWSELTTRSQIPDTPSPEEWQPKPPRTTLRGRCVKCPPGAYARASLLEIELNVVSARDQTTGHREQSRIARYHCGMRAGWCHTW